MNTARKGRAPKFEDEIRNIFISAGYKPQREQEINSIFNVQSHDGMGRRVTTRRPYIERFLEKTIFEPASGCWLWGGQLKGEGYGRFKVTRAIQTTAHRMAWLLFHGAIGDMFVCHKCDNPTCVNPDHIYLGTHTDNMRDKRMRDRSINIPRPGEKHHNAKLTTAEVLEMRKLREAGWRYAHLGQRYGVSLSQTRRICLRERWAHV
jgi:hypothetical protein